MEGGISLIWKIISKLRRHKFILEDNIKMVLEGMGCKAGDWIHLAQGRVLWPAFVK
jgi:hypothetical protein